MFKPYILLVNTLSKIRDLMNKVIIGKKHSKKHPIKDTLFDI